MLIDPHVNPRDLSPDELIDMMIDASIDGAVITCTHSAHDAAAYVEALIEEDFVALMGVELLTPHGALVFIPKVVDERFLAADWAPSGESAVPLTHRDEDGDLVDAGSLWALEALEAQLQRFEGVVLIAHPYTRLTERAWGDRAYTLKRASVVEVRTGRGLAVRDFLADQLAETKGWARVGSCSGDLSYLGASVTAVLESADHQAGLCDALEQGVCWPIEFERAEHPRPRYEGVKEDAGPRRVTLAEKERREALDAVNKRRPQKGGAPIDQIFGRGPKRSSPKSHGRARR